MSSSTLPARRQIGFVGLFFAMLPGVLLSGGCYVVLNWQFVGPMPGGFAGAAGVTACGILILIALAARPGNATHWFAFVVIMALAMTSAVLSTGISGLLFHDTILGMDSPHLAGVLHGAPGLIVSPFVFWVLHRLAGSASPWTLDEDERGPTG